MDLFEAYPRLAAVENPLLYGRSLRLIAVAGVVYDDEAFYFELSAPRNWGRSQQGRPVIGVGTPKVRPEGMRSLHKSLIDYVQKSWRCQVGLYPAGHSYVLGEEGTVYLLSDVEADFPYLLILTAPQLGGAEMPDALVQAVYLLPVSRFRPGLVDSPLLAVSRSALAEFLAPESWVFAALLAEPWATLLRVPATVPSASYLRPVLALRGLRRLIASEAFQPFSA